MVNPLTDEGVSIIIKINISLVNNGKELFKIILPAESVLDQRSKDVRKQFVQWVVSEASLVSVCYAGKIVSN